MKERKAFAFLVLCLVLAATILIQIQEPILNSQIPAGEVPEATQQRIVQTYGKLPLYFIENQGQLDPRVGYYIQGGDKSIYFTGSGVTFALTAALTDAGDEEPSSEALVRPAAYQESGVAGELGPQREAQSWERQSWERQRWVVKLEFVDANPNAQPVGQEPTDAVISYFKGPREEWTTGLPT
ncbi:MAG: hypothetical protein IH846_18895, partial [Acidobacteria bacterium]|nr:hypothetical protein [Acidobacteriota bacterium]